MPITLGDIYKDSRTALEEAGIETAVLDARILICHVLGITDTDFITDRNAQIPDSDAQAIHTLIHRRAQGEPVSLILGTKEFWSLPFKVTKDVLDPRPDTEMLVQAALDYFKDAPPAMILDLGTGTGCMPIALLTEWPQAQAVAVDISDAALAVARENATANGVQDRIRFVQGDFMGALDIDGSFDLVLSNPPYIPRADIESLSDEVKRFDPILALDGGMDGMDCYKKIISTLESLLNQGGICLLESGFGQHEDIARIVKDTGLTVNAIHPDLAGIPRAVEISIGEKDKKNPIGR